MFYRAFLCVAVVILTLSTPPPSGASPIGVWNGTFTSVTTGPFGTISDWEFAEGGTTTGTWVYDPPGETIIDFDPDGTYTYDEPILEGVCTGTAQQTGGISSEYTLTVEGTLDGDTLSGTYFISFAEPEWGDDEGTWEAARGETAVDLIRFDARAQGAQVLVSWNTASEVDVEGFHIARAGDDEGAFERIITALIPAQGSGIQGAEYRYEDGDVMAGLTYRYRLEVVDVYGGSTFHGPVSVTVHGACFVSAL